MSTLASAKSRALWWTLLSGGALGLLASFIQTIERINYAKNPQTPLACDLNSVFSCTNVFDAWQSSVFGFSNSLMCVVFFATIISIALVGLTGSRIHKNLRLVLQFFSIFFLGFGAWYLWQSAYRIGALCIFCLFCYGGVIAINAAWLRLNAAEYPQSARKLLAKLSKNGADIFIWLLYAIVIGFVLAWRFL